MNGGMMTARDWAARLESGDAGVGRVLTGAYGSDRIVVADRLRLLRRVIAAFLERFGNRPMRLFRCPGRINLRGMHVDTHGGWLNLMTHQREVVVAAAPEPDDRVTFVNVDPRFEPVAFGIRDGAGCGAFARDWMSFIMDADVRADLDARRGHWGHYLEGCLLSAQHRFRDRPLTGMTGVVGSDLPRGAALSSSAALCVAVTLAALGLNGLSLADAALITAARDAEWFTGSRCGLSDQAATILGGRDTLVSVALWPAALDVSSARRTRFPDALRILTINSYTERSLSGAALVAYTRNRFAYSLAMEILRVEMRAHGMPESLVARVDRLSNVTSEAFESVGGAGCLLRLLRGIPKALSIEELRRRYALPDLDQAYDQCFGGVPPDQRPTTIGLRGPLLFGIAESERARLFADALETGHYARAGLYMTIGHDGDRRLNAEGSPYLYDVGDAAMDRLIAENAPIELCPGAYGASSPALDALVDAALRAGAIGASLTGAGMAGTVLALCRSEDTDAIADAVRRYMDSPDYVTRVRSGNPFTPNEIAEAVIPNTATGRAGEIKL